VQALSQSSVTSTNLLRILRNVGTPVRIVRTLIVVASRRVSSSVDTVVHARTARGGLS